MGNIFWQISTTLDGYMEGPDGELDRTAQVIDGDFEKYASTMLESIDAFIIGRKTYELFVDYWPNATGSDADRLNSLPKYVVSGTLDRAEWNNAALVRPDHLEAEVRRIKNAAARAVAVFGSAELASSLMSTDLVDELRLIVTPFILGTGNPAFKGVDGHRLKLDGFERWESGTMFLNYSTNQKERS
jgi:dihydrofolate reductase